MLRSSLIAAFCSFSMLVSRLAPAQARDAAAAEELFRRGRQAMEAKRFGDAMAWFAESQRLDPAAGTLMNLATSEEKLGRTASAWQHWKEALDTLAPEDDRVPLARREVEALERKVPRLGVVLAAGREQGARVFRDDVELGPATQGVPLPVDPGVHTVTVQMPGHRVERVVVRVRDGERRQIDVLPGPADVAKAPEGRSTHSAPRTLGWALAGAGIAGIATAAVTGFMVVDYKHMVETDCPNKSCFTQQGVDAAATARTLTTVNTAAWIAGGASLALGTYFLVTSRPRDKETMTIAPSVGPDGVSLHCRGRF